MRGLCIKQIKDSVALKKKKKTHFVSPSFISYEAGTSPDWDGDTKVCLFKFCQKKTLFFVGYPAILTLRAMKRQTFQCPFKYYISQYILSTR